MSEKKHWVVTASGERALGAVVNDLMEVGFVIDPGGVLDAIGVVLGVATDEAAEKARHIRDVIEVSRPPPAEAL